MKVILTQAVHGLGEAGAIKEVADGYARNYLIPKKLAVMATAGSMKQAEAQAQLHIRKASKALTQAQQAGSSIEGKTIVLHARAGSENRLYGSVTAADVADALSTQYGMNIDRRKIDLGETIHRLGTYQATADLGHGVTARFNIEIAPEEAGATGKGRKATSQKAPTPDQPKEQAPAQASRQQQQAQEDPAEQAAQAEEEIPSAGDTLEPGSVTDAMLGKQDESNPM